MVGFYNHFVDAVFICHCEVRSNLQYLSSLHLDRRAIARDDGDFFCHSEERKRRGNLCLSFRPKGEISSILQWCVVWEISPFGRDDRGICRDDGVFLMSLRGTKQSTVVKLTTLRLPRFARNDELIIVYLQPGCNAVESGNVEKPRITNYFHVVCPSGHTSCV